MDKLEKTKLATKRCIDDSCLLWIYSLRAGCVECVWGGTFKEFLTTSLASGGLEARIMKFSHLASCLQLSGSPNSACTPSSFLLRLFSFFPYRMQLKGACG